MEKLYINMLETIRKNHLDQPITFLAKYLPYIMYTFYPLLIIYTYLYRKDLFLTTLLKPAFAFLFVTVVRKIINRPRPYDYMNIEPLVGHKHGESFPSRHAVSSMIIALVSIDVNVLLGLFLLIIAFLICLSRILCAVHHISDVIISIIIAIIVYII